MILVQMFPPLHPNCWAEASCPEQPCLCPHQVFSSEPRLRLLRMPPYVSLLNSVNTSVFHWGSYAQRKGAFIDRLKHLVLTSAHPLITIGIHRCLFHFLLSSHRNSLLFPLFHVSFNRMS